jgi:hypothetical protein
MMKKNGQHGRCHNAVFRGQGSMALKMPRLCVRLLSCFLLPSRQSQARTTRSTGFANPEICRPGRISTAGRS